MIPGRGLFRCTGNKITQRSGSIVLCIRIDRKVAGKRCNKKADTSAQGGDDAVFQLFHENLLYGVTIKYKPPKLYY